MGRRMGRVVCVDALGRGGTPAPPLPGVNARPIANAAHGPYNASMQTAPDPPFPPRICRNCSEDFAPKRKWQIYCMDECRAEWHEKVREAGKRVLEGEQGG